MKDMEDKYESLRLKNQLCFPLYLAAKEIVNNYACILSDLDLSYTQYVIMMYLWERESSNAKELSAALLLDPSTVTPILRKLEAKQYIKKERSPLDERNIIITLTKTGRELQDKALSVPCCMRENIDLTDEECIQLRDLLSKIIGSRKIGKNNIEQ